MLTTRTASAEAEKEVSERITCANCGTPVERQYCPNCGQKRTEGRLRFSHLAAEFVQNYLGVDSGIFFTIRQLLLRPGEAVNAFLAGKRKAFLKPVHFYLLMLTLYFVVSEVLDVNIMRLGEEVQQDMGYYQKPSLAQSTFYQQFQEIFSQNLKVVFTVLLFVLTLSLKLVYRKKPYTYAELLVFTLYIYGFSYILSSLQSALLAIPMSGTLHAFVIYGFFAGSAWYAVWAIYQFYGQKGVKQWVKAFLAYALSILFFSFLSGFMGLLIGFLIAFTEK